MCREESSIPELREDYSGVKKAHLFVAGKILAANLTMEESAQESERRNIRVFMRNFIEDGKIGS